MKKFLSTILFVLLLGVGVSFAQSDLGKNSLPLNEDLISISDAYPNPATSVVEFDYKTKATDAKITLFNVLGTEVAEYRLSSFENKVSIPVENLKSGVYFYTVSANNKNLKTKKFVVRH